MPADAIVKACQDLKLALQGKSNIEGEVQMDSIKQIQKALEPTYKIPIEQQAERHPRVEQKQKTLTKAQSPRVKAEASPSRVEPEKLQSPMKPRLVVASSALSVVVSSPTVDLLLIKIFLNSIISMQNAKFANADISNFNLGTPLKCQE